MIFRSTNVFVCTEAIVFVVIFCLPSCSRSPDPEETETSPISTTADSAMPISGYNNNSTNNAPNGTAGSIPTTPPTTGDTQIPRNIVINSDGGIDRGNTNPIDGSQATCTYECVQHSFCLSVNGVEHPEMACAQPGQVCCSLTETTETDPCTFDCISTEACTAAGGLEHTDMSCEGDSDICCQPSPPICTYDCFSRNHCINAGGVIHDDMVCDSVEDVCCEVNQDCVYDCILSSECSTAQGIEHPDMTCAGQTDICCQTEPTDDICPDTYACIEASSCPTEDAYAEYLCEKESDICCDVERCEDHQGTCRPGNNNNACEATEQPTLDFYCKGRHVCCIAE